MLVMCLRISELGILGFHYKAHEWAIGKAVCMFEGLASGNVTNCEYMDVWDNVRIGVLGSSGAMSPQDCALLGGLAGIFLLSYYFTR